MLTAAQREMLFLCSLAAMAAGACMKADSNPLPADPIDSIPEPPPPVRTFGVSPAAFTFADTIGRARVPRDSATIAATGTGAVTGLTVGTIAYGAGASGWLTASLRGDSAPTRIVIETRRDSLQPGTYTATVPIAGAASNSPQTVTVELRLAPAPRPIPIGGAVIMATGNLGACGSSLGQASANLVAAANPTYLFVLGDLAPPRTQPMNTLQDFLDCYDPVWGRFKAFTYAAVGDYEQDTRPGADSGFSRGFDAYFGDVTRTGAPGKNWYSFNIGSWHVIVLDVMSGGPLRPVRYNNGSEQLNWLRNDLRANRGARCTIALWHDPMWMSGSDPATPTDTNPQHSYRNQPIRGVWIALREYGADVVVNGGRHIYERFAPMRYDGSYEQPTELEFAADPDSGIVQFSTGLAGDGPLSTPPAQWPHPLSVYRSGGNGVLKLTLGDGQYTWEFINTQWSSIQDYGTGRCH